MKKMNLLYNLAVGLLAAALIALIIFKFVIPANNRGDVGFNGFEKITILDLTGQEIPLANLVPVNETMYCLILELTNCNSCIYKGIEDLKILKKSGKPCMALVVHQLIDEVEGWSATHDFSPFFMIKKEDFYEHIHTPVLPVMIKFENGKIQSHRFIRP